MSSIVFIVCSVPGEVAVVLCIADLVDTVNDSRVTIHSLRGDTQQYQSHQLDGIEQCTKSVHYYYYYYYSPAMLSEASFLVFRCVWWCYHIFFVEKLTTFLVIVASPTLSAFQVIVSAVLGKIQPQFLFTFIRVLPPREWCHPGRPGCPPPVIQVMPLSVCRVNSKNWKTILVRNWCNLNYHEHVLFYLFIYLFNLSIHSLKE